MPSAENYELNQIVKLLPPTDRARLLAHLEWQAMPLDSVVYAPGREHRYVYFPNRHHSVDQQLRRWLLLSLARLTGDHLNMTQGVCECYAVLKKR